MLLTTTFALLALAHSAFAAPKGWREARDVDNTKPATNGAAAVGDGIVCSLLVVDNTGSGQSPQDAGYSGDTSPAVHSPLGVLDTPVGPAAPSIGTIVTGTISGSAVATNALGALPQAGIGAAIVSGIVAAGSSAMATGNVVPTTSPAIPITSLSIPMPSPAVPTTPPQISTSAPAIPTAVIQPVVPAYSPPAGTSLVGLTAAMVKAIMPKALSCDGAPFPAECRTADQAAPLFAQSFKKWKIDSPAAQAAVLALVAFESGSLKYQIGHYGDAPPGKGTRNMQYPSWNQKYANDLFGAQAMAGKDPAAVLSAILKDDANDFGSGAWFLSTQCPTVLGQFATNPSQAWSAYLGPNCIGTVDTPDRDALWAAAKKALGVS